MGEGASGAVSGGLIGALAVVLSQQVGVVSLSTLLPSVELLVAVVAAGAIVGGLFGIVRGRRARREAEEELAREARGPDANS